MLTTKAYCGISNGSACTSKDYGPSYVLQAMGLSFEDISNSIRISWAANIDQDQLKREFSLLLDAAKKLVG